MSVLLVVSGASGSGKTTLCRQLQQKDMAYYAISATTRAMRAGEEHGKDYFFLTVDDFTAKIERGEFLEYAQVHNAYYGTLIAEVVNHLEQGKNVLIDIDVQGAAQIRACEHPLVQASLVDLFVSVELEELRKRLHNRGDDADSIELRMENAEYELTQKHLYQYELVSKSREQDYATFEKIFLDEQAEKANKP